MRWQITNDAPVYTQLVQQIERGIASGLLPPGERLASVRDMAAEAGVNPNTMQRALAELEREGLVYTQRASGRFVTEDASVIRQARQAIAEKQTGAFIRTMQELGISEEEMKDLIRRLWPLAQKQEREESPK